jgi:hypothetical protein
LGALSEEKRQKVEKCLDSIIELFETDVDSESIETSKDALTIMCESVYGEYDDIVMNEDHWEKEFVDQAELEIVHNEDGSVKVVDTVSGKEYPKTFASGKDAADYFYNDYSVQLVDYYDIADADDGSEKFASETPDYYGAKDDKAIGVIKTSYEKWSQDDIEAGDTDNENRSWDNEDGEPFANTYAAAEWLKSKGPLEPSSSNFQTGIWYSTVDANTDMQTGDVTNYAYHLSGFTDEQQEEIYDHVTGKSPIQDPDLTDLDEAQDNIVGPTGDDVNLITTSEEPKDLNIDDPASQNEQPAVVNEGKKSAYQEGFDRACKLYEKGMNGKNILTQLTETELANDTYSRVKRFQEGFQAGLKFQEQVDRDVNPDKYTDVITDAE